MFRCDVLSVAAGRPHPIQAGGDRRFDGATPSPAGGRAEIGVRTSSGRTVMADRMATWSDSRLCIQPELAVNARLVRNLAHELSSPAPPEFDCGGRDGRPGLDAVAVDRNVDRGRGAAGGYRLHQPRIREPVLVGLGPARQRSGRGRSGRDPAGPGGSSPTLRDSCRPACARRRAGRSGPPGGPPAEAVQSAWWRTAPVPCQATSTAAAGGCGPSRGARRRATGGQRPDRTRCRG